MNVGATSTKSRDASDTRSTSFDSPRLKGRADKERAIRKIGLRIGGRAVQRRHKFLVLKAEHGLDESDDSRCLAGMADIGFHGADGAKL